MEQPDRGAAATRVGRGSRDDELVTGRDDPPGEDVEAFGLDAVVVRGEHPHPANVPSNPRVRAQTR